MMKETKRISLATFIVALLVMAAICVVLIYMIVSDKNKDNKEENTNVSSNSGVVNNQNSGNKDINNSSSDENKVLTEKEARDILDQKYEVLRKLNVLSEKYFKITSESYEYDLSSYVRFINIENYDEVVNKYFSNNMKKVFGEYHILNKIEGKSSVVDVHPEKYGWAEEFKDITITDTKISAVLKTKIYNDFISRFIEKEGKIILIKEGNDWLIDEFDLFHIDPKVWEDLL